jgi:hypothetical protein
MRQLNATVPGRPQAGTFTDGVVFMRYAVVRADQPGS